MSTWKRDAVSEARHKAQTGSSPTSKVLLFFILFFVLLLFFLWDLIVFCKRLRLFVVVGCLKKVVVKVDSETGQSFHFLLVIEL